MTVAMALAERENAPFFTGTEECQGRGVGARDALHGPDPGTPLPPPPPLSTPTHPPQPELFDLSVEEEPGGSPPPCLGEQRGPQDQDQQRTVEQTVD